MKIQGPAGPIKPTELKQKTPNRGNQSLEFRKVMEQVSKDKGDTDAPGPAMPVEPLTGVRIGESIETKVKVMLDELHGLMDLVEGYIEKLSDGSVKGTDLGPILSHLGAKVQFLKDKSHGEALPQRLQDILTELEITVAVEAAKLRRGDYS